MNILKYKKIALGFSTLLVLGSIVALLVFGLKLSIDFTGGTVFRIVSIEQIDQEQIANAIQEISQVQIDNVTTEDSTLTFRMPPIDSAVVEQIKLELTDTYLVTIDSVETVGPLIGAETTRRGFVALGLVMGAIVIYIAYAFRNIPEPYSSWRFGISAIIAMLHDAIIVLGVFAVLGALLGVEIDALFLTAMLTVIGFSVHDSIVVFDRIRENLSKLPSSKSFEEIANYSLVETLNRSLGTSLTVVLTLLSLFMLGGESIRFFVLALLVGIIAGTYSSIFVASPVLVIWENYSKKRK